MTSPFKKILGQGLLEAIVALALILTIIFSIVALITANLLGQKESESQIIASNLAREGIEVVRNIRDSNWLKQDTDPTVEWDEGLKEADPLNVTAIADFDKDNNAWQLIFEVNDINDVDARLYRQGGIYQHKNGQPTIFYRLLTLHSICLDLTSGIETIYSQTSCPSDQTKIGIDVKSQVNYFQQGKLRQAILKDRIYDWKY